jgi:hypothetical protein
MKKAGGLIMLLLAALLVAMPAAAVTPGVANGADASMLGTKINIQEEVGGTFTAEMMAALAVVPNEAQAISYTNMMTGSEAITRVAYYGRDVGRLSNYESTPGAGGDGLLARFY